MTSRKRTPRWLLATVAGCAVLVDAFLEMVPKLSDELAPIPRPRPAVPPARTSATPA